MTNAYCDLATLKSAGALNISGSVYDGRLLSLLEEASRVIDGYCNRHFYTLEATRQFEACWRSAGLQQLLVPDLTSAATVRVAARAGNGAVPDHWPDASPDAGLEWRTATYRLYPLDASPDQPWGRPYTRLAIGLRRDFPLRQPDGHFLVEVTGRWGYRKVIADIGASIAPEEALEPGARTMTVTATETAGKALAAGQTLAVEQEQLYVTAVDGQQVTVERGVNGSEAAAHAAGTSIGVYRYPGPVTEACLQLAAGQWQGRNGSEDTEGLSREVEGLLSPYRKLSV